MPNVSGTGTVWNLPNYIGELFTASPTETPILSMIGGLDGLKQTSNFEFPVDTLYSHESPSQPAITETASLTAPTAISYTRTQDKNVTQIFHEQISVSYEKLANPGRLTGINTAGSENPVSDELDFQIARALEKIARDAEWTIINGTYQIATNAGTANKTRGLNENAGVTVNSLGAKLSKTLIQQLLREMFAAGAKFKNAVIVVNAFQKQLLSDIYGYAPTDRSVGGLNIKQIETDVGSLGVILHPFQTASTLGIYEMSVLGVVSQPVEGKGHLFYEPLAKTGASESGQIFGKLGLDHGPSFLHGKITNLATS